LQGYAVNLEIKGLTNAIIGLRDVARYAQAAQSAVKNIGPIAVIGGGSGSGASGGRGGGGRGSGGPMTIAQAMRLQAQGLNAQSSLIQAQRRAQRLAAPQQTPAQKAFRNLVYSTRVGVGANGQMSVMPLIGNLVKAIGTLGPEAELAATAIAGLVLVMTAVEQVAMHAAEYGKGFSQSYYGGGGTPAETAKLGALGRASGFSQQQITDMARAYGEALKNNPYALAQAAAHGYAPNYAGPFGDIDDTRRFLAGFKDIMHAANDDIARRLARGTPLENLIWMRDASPDVREGAIKNLEQNLTPEQRRADADALIKFNEAMGDLDRELVKLGNMTLPAVSAGLGALDKILSGYINSPWMNPANWAGTPGDGSPGGGPPGSRHGGLPDWVNHLPKWINPFGKGPETPAQKAEAEKQARMQANTDAVNRNTDATNNNTRQLNGQRQVYGGGPGAQAALPGQYFNPNNPTRDQIRLGQIPV
jgi:hypothetical protein